MSVPPYILRAMVEEDKAFIFTTWIKIYHEVPPMNLCPNDIYLPNMRLIIARLLEKASVLVACTPEDPSSILGYVVYDFVKLEDDSSILVLHWLHIKSIFRHMALAKHILKTIYPTLKVDPIICTHNFKAFKSLRNSYLLSLDPFYIHKE